MREANKWLTDIEKANNQTGTSKLSAIKGNRYQVTYLMKIVLKKCNKSLIKTNVLIDHLISFLGSSAASRRAKESFGADIIGTQIELKFCHN